MMESKPENSLGLFCRVLKFAAYKHKSQRRKDAEASPYINHPISLADILSNVGGVDDPIVLCAALLHDTIEDTETTEKEIREAFGEKICTIVLEVTDDKSLPKNERKRLQITHAGSSSPEAKLVKLADKISNLIDIAHSPPKGWNMERKREYFDWSKSVVDQVRGTSPSLEALFDNIYSDGRKKISEAD